jgi:hypothetical protein
MKPTAMLTILAIVLLAPALARAQTRTTDVGGTLLRAGPSGPLPAVGVAVTLNSTQFGRSTRIYTGNDGSYYFHAVPLGLYTLEVWIEGTKPLTFPIQVSGMPFTRVPDQYISSPRAQPIGPLRAQPIGPSRAQPASPAVARFLGDWRTLGPATKDITRVAIRFDGSDLFVHMWSACHPTDCDWREVRIAPSNVRSDGNMFISWTFSSAVHTQRLVVLPDGRLMVSGREHYTSSSEGADRNYVEYFTR